MKIWGNTRRQQGNCFSNLAKEYTGRSYQKLTNDSFKEYIPKLEIMQLQHEKEISLHQIDRDSLPKTRLLLNNLWLYDTVQVFKQGSTKYTSVKDLFCSQVNESFPIKFTRRLKSIILAVSDRLYS